MRVSYVEGHYGDAFLRIGSTEALAQTDQQKALVLYWTGLIQEKRNDPKDAITAWQSLLAMSSDAMTSQMRDDATQHLDALTTGTPTLGSWNSSGHAYGSQCNGYSRIYYIDACSESNSRCQRAGRKIDLSMLCTHVINFIMHLIKYFCS